MGNYVRRSISRRSRTVPADRPAMPQQHGQPCLGVKVRRSGLGRRSRIGPDMSAGAAGRSPVAALYGA